MIDLRLGDCLEILRTLGDSSVDSVLTDPPYGLSYMGNKWDYDVPSEEIWSEVLRVLKPGGHLLSFGGSRTYHRMAVSIEDSGFEIRDQIFWVYSSGFPKSMDISKAIDKKLGRKREVIGHKPGVYAVDGNDVGGFKTGLKQKKVQVEITKSSSKEAKHFEGWGTTLKPAHEPIVLARRRPIQTVVSNVLEYGTGGINIDESRIGERWPANVIHDGSPEATEGMGKASRYFYGSKPSKKDRGEGNTHPTVKPTDLMKYLVRLITPAGGIVMDPFMGSGTTGVAAKSEGFSFLGIEREPDYLEIAKARIHASD